LVGHGELTMPDYDTRFDFGEGQEERCEEITQQFGETIKQMVDRTEEEEIEFAFLAYKEGGAWKRTEIIEGEGKSMTSGGSIPVKKLREAKRQFDRGTPLVLVHTHPGGDPSPSPGDLINYIKDLEKWRGIQGAKNSSSYNYTPPDTGILEAVTAAAKQDGDYILGGVFTHEDHGDIPSSRTLDHIKDKVRSIDTAMLGVITGRTSKEQWEKKWEEYRDLIDNIGDFCITEVP